MRLSQIKLFLRGQLAVDSFKTEIESEVLTYKHQLAKRGVSAPINLIEDEYFDLAKEDLDAFESLSRSGRLDEYEISYIADALLLSEKVKAPGDSTNNFLETFSISDG
ncbi:MAG TPA: hypothetical protein VMH27_15300 [Puia sp.]|nr:hypothetical protein [Puia sp.]